MFVEDIEGGLGLAHGDELLCSLQNLVSGCAKAEGVQGELFGLL